MTHLARRPARRARGAARAAVRPTALAILLLVPLFSGAPARLASAFQGGPEFKGHSVTDFPQVRHLIESARSRLSAGADAEAFEDLQEVVDRYPNQMYRGDDGIYHGAREYCMDLLAELDEDRLATYRRVYEPIARKLFERATARQDPGAFAVVVERFLFTSYGAEALERIGRIHDDRGEWEEAAHYYRESIAPGHGRDVTPELLVRLGHCLRRIGDREALLALRNEHDAAIASTTVRAAGSDRPTHRVFEEWLDAPWPEADTWSETWDQYGGTPDHVPAADPYQGPISKSIGVPLDFDALDPYSPSRSTRYLMARFLPDLDELQPPFHPVVDASIAYLHDGLRIDAINLINGKRKWSYESEPSPVAVPHPRMIFGAAYADGIVYAALETEVDSQTLQYKLTPIKLPMPKRRLHAFDGETGGLVWSHLGIDEEDPEKRAFLERASICTPPLLWRDRLYVGASYFEGKIHSYVCCFDRRDGKLLWKTLVCTGQQELNMFGNQFMEYVALPLALEDGTVYFVSNLGLVAAIDARGGTIRWINEYPIIPLPHPQNFHPRIRELSWYANPPVVHEGTLLVTPLDADHMFAFDVASGEAKWSHERFRRGRGLAGSWDSLYCLGVHDGRAILAGDEVLALDMETRRVDWVYPFLEPDETTAGLGQIAEDRIYVPTQYGLHEIDAAGGKRRIEPIPWEHGPRDAGNVLSFQNLLLSASASKLSIFFRWDEMAKKLLTELGRHPDAIELHLKLGDGYTHAGQLSPALEHYGKAMDLTRANPRESAFAQRASQGLYRVHATLGDQAWKRGDAAAASDFYRNALEYAFDEESLVRGHLNFERLYRDTRDSRALREHYERMLREIPHVRFTFASVDRSFARVADNAISAGLYALLRLADLDMKEKNGAVAVGRYQRVLEEFAGERLADGTSETHAREQIDFLIRTFGREIYATFEEQAEERFAKAKRTREPRDFETVLALYPNSSIIQDCLLEFSRVLQDLGDYSQVLEILRGFLRKFPRSKLEHRVLSEILSAYRTLGFDEAAAYVDALRSGKASGEDRARADSGRAVSTPRGDLTPPLEQAWRRPFSGKGTLGFVEVTGTAPPWLADRLILSGDDSLLCLDVDAGEILWERSGMRLGGSGTTHYQDGRLYLRTVEDELICLDPREGKEEWSRIFDERILELSVAPGTILVATRGPNKNSFVVHGLDVLTGSRVWSRHVLGNFQKPLYVTDGAVLVRVASRSRGQVLALESFTGKDLGEIEVEPSFKPVPLEGRRLVVAEGRQELALLDLDGVDPNRYAPSPDTRWNYARDDHWLKFFYRLGTRLAVLLDDRLVAVDADTGRVEWERKLENGNKLDWIPGMEDQDPGILYFKLRRTDAKPENALIAIRAEDGEVLWEQELPKNPIFVKRLLRAGSTLAVQVTQYNTDARVQVLLLDAETGEPLQHLEYEGNYYAEVVHRAGNLCIITGSKLHILRGGRE